MNKIIMMILLAAQLFSNCSQDMFIANDGARNSADYAQKGNHKYALIEINSAITYANQALISCKGKITKDKMKQLSKDVIIMRSIRNKIKKKIN